MPLTGARLPAGGRTLSPCFVLACPCAAQWHRAGCLQAAETLQSGDGRAALLKQATRGGDPRTPRGRGPTFFWDLVPYLAHRASLPLFCFRPSPPCVWAAAIMYRAKARLLCSAGVCWQMWIPCPVLSPVHLVPCLPGLGARNVPRLLGCSHHRPSGLL